MGQDGHSDPYPWTTVVAGRPTSNGTRFDPWLKEIGALAKKVGGVEKLIAPKRRAEAEGLSGKKLVASLASDGGRIRRPIIVTPKGTTLGFAADAKERLEDLL